MVAKKMAINFSKESKLSIKNKKRMVCKNQVKN